MIFFWAQPAQGFEALHPYVKTAFRVRVWTRCDSVLTGELSFRASPNKHAECVPFFDPLRMWNPNKHAGFPRLPERNLLPSTRQNSNASPPATLKVSTLSANSRQL